MVISICERDRKNRKGRREKKEVVLSEFGTKVWDKRPMPGKSESCIAKMCWPRAVGPQSSHRARPVVSSACPQGHLGNPVHSENWCPLDLSKTHA